VTGAVGYRELMPSPATETRSLSELVNRLMELGWLPTSRQQQPIERLVGWESAVIRTDDGWIYRFSRLDADSFEREVAVLAAVEGPLCVNTPRIEMVDSAHRVIAYRTLVGHDLDLRAAMSLPPSDRHDLVGSLAAALAGMHDLKPQLPNSISIPPLDGSTILRPADAVREHLSGRQRDLIDWLLTRWQDTPLAHPSEDAALLHGDFHPGNMVFTTPTGALSGLWDFSCVERGDPSGDLRYLVGDSAPLTVEIIQSYEAMTGRSIDLVGARLVRVLEEISDAVEERRSLEPVLHALESLKSHLTRGYNGSSATH
jgi:aminoglycoside phosphotransferase (APT) family kinase protein